MTDERPAYLKAPEVAALLRRSVKRLYAMIATDATFPVTKLPGGGLLFPRAALERWLQGRTQGMRAPLRLVAGSGTSAAPQRTAPRDALKESAP